MTTERIPLLDLTRDPGLLEELRAAFERVLRSGIYIMGPELEAMEREFAAFLGADHALGVSSGTDALILALMALGVGPGDEVICPTYTFFASAGSIARLGARPVFIDVDPVSYNCTAEAVAAAITRRTRAIMPVHLFGQCADMTGIQALAEKRGIPVVEDAAQAIGARHGRSQAGTIGAFGCFSFFPSKNLGCLGDGGLLTTNDAGLAERARILRVHGMQPKYHHRAVGGNFRLDALQAAFLRVKLPRLPAATEARRQNAALYLELLTEAGIAGDGPLDVPDRGIALPAIGPEHTINQFTIRVGGGRRDALRDALLQQQIGCEVYYPIPLHLQECFRELGHTAGEFPVSEMAAQQTLALPVFPELRQDEVRRVVRAVAAFCRS
jgi:dTDP-4-amino-4,6-dideoxygalactose transaminase